MPILSKRKASQKTQASKDSLPPEKYDWPALNKLLPGGYDPYSTRRDGDWFDERAAKKALDFFEHPLDGVLTHVKGELAGKRLTLVDWQRAIIAAIFGWRGEDGTRRYRTVFIFVPRKNGKTTLAAGIILYTLLCDGEQGAEVYSAAGDAEQASLVYSPASGMVLNDPELRKRCRVYHTYKSIVYDATNSSYKAITAEAKTKHGFNTHCAVVDEVHTQPNRELVDVLETSTGSRRQPLIVFITTSDYERPGSICNEKHEIACKVRDGIIPDPTFLPVIYQAERTDDWNDSKTWYKANPNLGISLKLDYFKSMYLKAKETPSFENTFKRLHLNIRTEQDIRWIPMDKWDLCKAGVTWEELRGQICYAGLDLSSTSDTTSLVLFFPELNNAVWPIFWVPEATAQQRETESGTPYATWARQGFMKLTRGNVVDYDVIRASINEINKHCRIKELAIDRWNSTQLQTQLMGDGLEIVPFGQGYASMSAPCKELEKLIISVGFRHGGHPVLRWMASNCSIDLDAAGNIKPTKERSGDKIDGIVALAMGIGRALVRVSVRSIYETRGLLGVGEENALQERT